MSRDYAKENKSLRKDLLELLSNLDWHDNVNLAAAGGIRYGARLLELKRLGYRIEDEDIVKGKRYRLKSLHRDQPQEKRIRIYVSKQEARDLIKGVVTTELSAAVVTALSVFEANEHKL